MLVLLADKITVFKTKLIGKMIKLIPCFLLLLLGACQEQERPTEQEAKLEMGREKANRDSILLEQMRVYYKNAKKKKAATPSTKASSRTEQSRAVVKQKTATSFPNCSYSKVLLYELNGNGNHHGAASVFRQRTGRRKELKPAEIKSFLNLLNAKSSYGNTTAACHEPRIGLVFYTKEEAPCAYLSLCLACNNVYTMPKITLGLQSGMESGFSLKSRKKLHKILEDWGLPDENYSELFDDEEMLEQFLRKREKGH